MSLGYGALLDAYGMWLMTPTFILCCLILGIVVIKTKEPDAVVAQKKSKMKENEESFFDIFKKLVRNMQYLILILTIFLMTTGMSAGHTLTAVKLTGLGGGNLEYGIMITLTSLCEVLLLLVVSKYIKRFSPAILLAIAYFSIIVKMLALGWAPSVPVVIMAQVFHGIGYGIMHGAVVSYIHKVVDHRSLFTAQTGYGISLGLGNILGSLLGGVISTAVGIDTMVFIMTALPVVSFLIMFGNNLYLKRQASLPE